MSAPPADDDARGVPETPAVPAEENPAGVPEPPVDPVAELSPIDGGEGEGAMSRGQLQRLAIRGASWTLLHTVIALPIAFAVNILIARVLGVVDYGRLAYLTSVMSMVESIISMGIGIGVVQFGSKAHAAGRTAEVVKLLSSAQAVRLATVAPVMTLLVVSIAEVGPVLLGIAVVFGVLIPSVVGAATYCFGIESKTAEDAKNAMLVNALTQAAVVVAVLTVGSADSVWATRLIFGGIGVLLALFYIAPMYRRAVFRPRFRRFPTGFWKFALPAGAAAAVGTMISSRVEVVVLTWMDAAEAAGLFALAFGLAAHLFGPAQALVAPLVPAISGLHEVDGAAVAPALARTLRASATAVGAIVAAALPLFAFLVPLIYGEDFAGAVPLLIVLGLSGGLVVIVSPLTAFVMARLLGSRLLLTNIVSLGANVVLMLVLVPLLGVWGAVIGNVTSAVLQLLILLLGESRLAGLRWTTTMASLGPYAAGGMACVSVWALVTALAWPTIVASAVAAAGSFALFVGLLWLARTGLSRADVDAIGRALPGPVRPVGRALLLCCAATREGSR